VKAEDAPDILGETWLGEYGFQLTRGFRALKVWMALKYHGLAGYAAAIEHDLALAEHLASRVREVPDLELSAAPSLSIVCFRYAPPDLRGDDNRLNTLNRRLVTAIQRGGRAFLAGTMLGDRFVLRACIINPRSTREDIDLLVELVRATGQRLAAEA
jgi:glutamate/tyrosine decarboxylase-like PLP-dependent enzyme